MFLRVDDRAVTTAAGHLWQQTDACRDLAAAVLHLPRPESTAVRHGCGDLVEVCADAAELLAIDLELLTERLREGARVYDAVERALTAAADPRP